MMILIWAGELARSQADDFFFLSVGGMIVPSKGAVSVPRALYERADG